MDRDELKNWLAALSIGGGLLGAAPAEAGDPPPPAERVRPAEVKGKVAGEARPVRPKIAPRYVVINHEEQYSLWPAAVPPPQGWKKQGQAADLRASARGVKVADATEFKVVINHEEQYSIWPADRALPRGWRVEGEPCKLSDCLGRLDPPR